nr:vesicle transport protein SEC20 isoform X2 [Saimiri boliviensis boliviensis]
MLEEIECSAKAQDIRDCSGPLSSLTELNTKVKEKFQQLHHRIQDLEQSAKEQDKESEKQLLLQEVENHKKQMLSNQTSWRKANLTCKIAIDNLEKAELLQGGDLLRQRKTTKESLAQTSSAITESLMGISRMMAQQVQQSEEAMQSLVQQTGRSKRRASRRSHGHSLFTTYLNISAQNQPAAFSQCVLWVRHWRAREQRDNSASESRAFMLWCGERMPALLTVGRRHCPAGGFWGVERVQCSWGPFCGSDSY